MMSDNSKTKPTPALKQRPSWREYQARLNSSKTTRQRHIKLARVLLSGIVLISGLYILGNYIFTATKDQTRPSVSTHVDQRDPTATGQIRKTDVRVLIDDHAFVNLNDRHFTFDYEGQLYTVETSLDIPLQTRLLKAMDRVNSRYIGLVAMDPVTGRILTMASFDKTGNLKSPCTSGLFPAASIFKIVTAAAAIEQCGYTARSKMKFNGYKHTLYKSQLKERTNRYTNTISFKNSFAQSVNPVFGKIGVLYLGKAQLEAYGEAFGFNRQLAFEILCAPSLLTIEDTSYHWAEIASGFNNQTTLSPLHGAVLAAVPLNHGRLVEPTIVDRIVDKHGEVFYRNKPTFAGQATSAETANIVAALMETTVKSGTCRKAFRGAKRDRILSRLVIGGKTGSIYDRSHTIRFDWFVGYAHAQKGPGKMAVSVLVAHEEYIGIRASEYARMAFRQYFENYFARTKNAGPKVAS
jgi:cell division protein FtsI/penicillin-binding protein 2